MRIIVAVLLIAGCASQSSELRTQTAQALSDCLRRHPDGNECESLSRQNDRLQAQRTAHARAVWSDDDGGSEFNKIYKPRPRLTCKPDGLGNQVCE